MTLGDSEGVSVLDDVAEGDSVSVGDWLIENESDISELGDAVSVAGLKETVTDVL